LNFAQIFGVSKLDSTGYRTALLVVMVQYRRVT